jgi:hypothetical protein
MAKKTVWVVIIVALLALGIFIAMRRSHMMSGAGVQQDLVAVSTDGAQIPPSADITSATGKLPKGVVAQRSGDMIISLALNPYPPSAGQPSDFDITLTDVNGKAINDASISLNLTMPSMWMPPNQPAMEFVSDGKYHATAPFTMRGGWRIEVIITRGSEKQSVFFDVGM